MEKEMEVLQRGRKTHLGVALKPGPQSGASARGCEGDWEFRAVVVMACEGVSGRLKT